RHTAYFIPAISQQVYSYQNIQGKEKWSQLQANPNRNCGLAVVDGVLTSVGGWNMMVPLTHCLVSERMGTGKMVRNLPSHANTT
ncbi:hypothetical protein GBAR_LOCUS31268, partial [Geodia barretti]